MFEGVSALTDGLSDVTNVADSLRALLQMFAGEELAPVPEETPLIQEAPQEPTPRDFLGQTLQGILLDEIAMRLEVAIAT